MTPDPSPATSGIQRAYRTAEGEKVFEYAGPTGSCWFTASELISNDRQVRTRISSEAGVTLLSANSMAPLKDSVEQWTEFEQGALASRPGWHGDLFVLGDGEVVAATLNATCAVAFEPNAKFRPSGTLAEWKSGIRPFVEDQILPMLALGVALSGPLLRFAPADYLPPQIELFGEPGSGKTTLGILASSVWSGTVGSSIGGGENWDLTINALDDLRRQHADMFLNQDDASLTAGSLADQAKLRIDAVMKSSGSSLKKRYGDRAGTAVVRVPRMFSANDSLEHLAAQKHPDVRDAVLDRVMFIRVDKLDGPQSFAVFNTVPLGYADRATAAGALRQVTSQTFGSAGRAFVKFLVDRVAAEAEGFELVIRSRCEGATHNLPLAGPLRHRQMLALIQVTLELAIEAEVVDALWGEPRAVIGILHEMACKSSNLAISKSPLEELQAFFLEHRANKLKNIAIPRIPTKRDSIAVWGMYRIAGNEVQLWVDPDSFALGIPAPHLLLTKSKQAGLLQTHPSERDRRTIQAPTALKRHFFGRVHAFLFPVPKRRRRGQRRS